VTAFVAVLCGLVGLIIGSFLNVVVYRVPQHLSVVHPRSRCPGCETTIAPRDNIPVLSWILLRGRCRYCGMAISARYPLVELLTGVLFAAVALQFPDSIEIVPLCIGMAGLVALSFIDLDTRLLPKRVVWPVTGAVLLGFVLTAAVEDRWDDLQRALLGSVVSAAAIGAIWFVYPAGMGFGDVRLQVLLGMMLGWISRGTVLAGFWLAFLLGGVISMAVLITQGAAARKKAIPFGPWLCLGCAVALLWPATGRWVEEHQIEPLADAIDQIAVDP
jgi:leader peptidase (prepilin peptidase)/N-methyltransferase